MIKSFNLFFLTFFFIGKIKYAPGTVASFFTSIIFFFLFDVLNIITLAILVLLIFCYSLIAINISFDEFTDEDPQEIVIDEVVGQLLPILAIPIYEILYPIPHIYYFVSAFLLFRLFDIWKPYPVNYIDDNVRGALGIMLDDIFASFYSIIILCLFFFYLGG